MRPRTLLIDSEQLESGRALDKKLRAAAMPSQQPARYSTTLSATFMPALA